MVSELVRASCTRQDRPRFNRSSPRCAVGFVCHKLPRVIGRHARPVLDTSLDVTPLESGRLDSLIAMSLSIRALHSLSDDELVALHDRQAEHTTIGIDYYLDEIRRREQLAMMRSSEALARASHRLTVANTWLAGVAGVAAVIALFT